VGVQIGAFSRADAVRQEIARVNMAEPHLIAKTDALVTEAQTTRGTLYRARLVGLSKAGARDACRRLID
jgi:D-alanyl-D-alanine carboxypeptidase